MRDAILGARASDIDLATRLTPDVVIDRLRAAGIKSVPTGLAHGTVTGVIECGPVEITTLRRDVATDGRHAVVAFTDDWREDAARRDFTINALSADPDTCEIFDYFGGCDDLQMGRVRFIGDPLKRIAEDHLRILRFFRFHARFGKGSPDAAGLAACTERANDLMALSRERIAAELLKLLDADDPVATVHVMLAHGIFTPILPEFQSVSVLERVVRLEITFSIAASNLRRLAALIGPDPSLARAIATRLKLSRAQTRRLVTACGWERGYSSVRALSYQIGIESARDFLLLGDGQEEDLHALETLALPRLPIAGGGLIARGLEAGPVVAQTLRAIEDAWVAADFPTGQPFETLIADALRRAKP